MTTPSPFPLKTFVCTDLPTARGVSPFYNAGGVVGTKDCVLLDDLNTGHLVMFGGDFGGAISSGTGQAETYAYNGITDTWRMISPFCHGPGNVTPQEPSDRYPWFHDPVRGLYWVIGGGFLGPVSGAGLCNLAGPNPSDPAMTSVAGSTYFMGILSMPANPIATTPLMWTPYERGDAYAGYAVVSGPGGPGTGLSPAGPGVIAGTANGFYDPVTDNVFNLYGHGGSGPPLYSEPLNIWRMKLSTRTVQPPTPIQVAMNPLDFTTSASASLGTFLNYPNAFCYLAVDIMGRRGYHLAVWSATSRSTGEADSFRHRRRLWSFNLDDPSQQRMEPDPPFNTPDYGPFTGSNGYFQGGPFFDLSEDSQTGCHQPTWDTRNRCLVNFVKQNQTGVIYGVEVFHPYPWRNAGGVMQPAGTWETIPIVLDNPTKGVRIVGESFNRPSGHCTFYNRVHNYHFSAGGGSFRGSYRPSPTDEPNSLERNAAPFEYYRWRYA